MCCFTIYIHTYNLSLVLKILPAACRESLGNGLRNYFTLFRAYTFCIFTADIQHTEQKECNVDSLALMVTGTFSVNFPAIIQLLSLTFIVYFVRLLHDHEMEI